MKSLQEYIDIAQDMAYNSKYINLGIERKISTKEENGIVAISIYCYTMNGKYKGNYKCGFYNKETGEYKAGYDVNLDTKEVR